MRPLKLVIRQHVQVPSNFGSKHQFRTDLKQVGKIEYADSYQIFKCLNPSAPMDKDSQFALWLYRTFGPGIYVVYAWQRGYPGIWIFMKVNLTEDGFMRVPKYMSNEQREKEKNIIEYKRLTRSLKSADENERKKIQEDIEDLKEDIDINKLIIDIDKPRRYGCYPFLKSTIPVYRFHNYEDYNAYDDQVTQESVKGGYSLW